LESAGSHEIARKIRRAKKLDIKRYKYTWLTKVGGSAVLFSVGIGEA
jgi:hypothetical protein